MKSIGSFFLATSLCMWLPGCAEKLETEETVTSPEPVSVPEAPAPSTTPVQDLDAYASALAKASVGNAITFKRVDDSRANVRVNPQDNFTMSSYIIYFTSDKKNYRLNEVLRDGDAAYESNSKKMDAWKSEFCTQELRGIMLKFDIHFVMGQVLTPKMSEQNHMKLTTQCSQ